jgi:hypothetical protein
MCIHDLPKKPTNYKIGLRVDTKNNNRLDPKSSFFVNNDRNIAFQLRKTTVIFDSSKEQSDIFLEPNDTLIVKSSEGDFKLQIRSIVEIGTAHTDVLELDNDDKNMLKLQP